MSDRMTGKTNEAVNGKTTRQGWAQFIKFNLVGVLNTLVDFVLFTLLITVGLHYLAAQCVSYAGGVINSYICNKKWTFANREKTTSSQFIRFVAVNGVSFGLSLAVLFVLGNGLGIHPVTAKVAATALTMVVNFAGTKWFVFRKEGAH
ncbi:GtrA family protein [Paenibacillus sp. J2TS4]|uniref:GtrA family protein n=1 Tax=Paenibacillus sp. J2TS4 TaxID=2807194 RepID=UPI001B2089CC|nr:GtrA family protein [Paenibacillus sp. J2TS4]GIP36164.1 GtrA-like protein [Paenibacillus sp. J2TS4]